MKKFHFNEQDENGNKQRQNLFCQSNMRITVEKRGYFYIDRNVLYIGHIGGHLLGKKYG